MLKFAFLIKSSMPKSKSFFYQTILIILLSCYSFSCSVTKPSYNSAKNNNQDIVYFDKIGLVKKKTVFAKIAPYVVTTAAAGVLFAGTGSLINEETGEEYGAMYPIIATATIGGLGGLLVTGILPNKENKKKIIVNESNINTWWSAVQKADSRYKNYSLTVHNNRKYLKNNVAVAVKNSNYKYLSSRVIEEENAYDRSRYSSSGDGVTELIVTGAAIYVGYEVLKWFFGGSSGSSASSGRSSANSCNCDVSYSSSSFESGAKILSYSFWGCGNSASIGKIQNRGTQYETYGRTYSSQDAAISALAKEKGCSSWGWK